MTEEQHRAETAVAGAPKVEVWDLPVRLFHWSLVAAFVTAFLTAGVYGRIHTAAGYTVAALVAFRVFWGLAGTQHARFSDFVTSPFAVLAYLRRMVSGHGKRHLGHNPAGGMMILALLLLCAALGFTGWLQFRPEFFGNEQLVIIHTTLGWTAVLLIPLHLVGVVVSSLAHRENLVAAMLSGKKRAEPGMLAPEPLPTAVADRIRSAHAFAVAAFLAVAAMLIWPSVEAQIEISERRARIAAKVQAEAQAKAEAKAAAQAQPVAQPVTQQVTPAGPLPQTATTVPSVGATGDPAADQGRSAQVDLIVPADGKTEAVAQTDAAGASTVEPAGAQATPVPPRTTQAVRARQDDEDNGGKRRRRRRRRGRSSDDD